MIRSIRKNIEDRLADEILLGHVAKEDAIHVDVKKDGLVFTSDGPKVMTTNEK